MEELRPLPLVKAGCRTSDICCNTLHILTQEAYLADESLDNLQL